ncbi:MAG: hypothetical protein QOJ07_1460 [Thermoleophilaceae bacterium]|nr:hypothetical protein [Thermoleophilaceae bacterium]
MVFLFVPTPKPPPLSGATLGLLRMRRLIGLLGLAVAAFPAAAQADVSVFGSDLSGTPDPRLAEAHQADTLFFNTQLAGAPATVPARGQITAIRLKGVAQKIGGEDPNNEFHFQVLHPNGDGSYGVEITSQPFRLPVVADASTVTEFEPVNFCADSGDIVAFNDEGGFTSNYQSGTPFQVFGPQDAQVNWFERDNGTNNGATFEPNQRVLNDAAGKPRQTDQGKPLVKELLMQMTLGTGFDATEVCPGGHLGRQHKGLEITDGQRVTVRGGVAKVRSKCADNTYDYCKGTMTLSADGIALGSAPFKIAASATTNVHVPLTNAGTGLVDTRGRELTSVVADSQDSKGYKATTTNDVVLVSANPTPSGFAGVRFPRAQTATVASTKFTVKASCPPGTSGACTGKVTLLSQRKIGRKLLKLGSGAFTIAPGRSGKVALKMSSSALKRVRKLKRIPAIASVSSADGAGHTAAARVKVTLKARQSR